MGFRLNLLNILGVRISDEIYVNNITVIIQPDVNFFFFFYHIFSFLSSDNTVYEGSKGNRYLLGILWVPP